MIRLLTILALFSICFSQDCETGYSYINNDCFGIPDGMAYINECGYCVVETGDQSCILGCDDIWATEGNEAVIDECGICQGDRSTCNQ